MVGPTTRCLRVGGCDVGRRGAGADRWAPSAARPPFVDADHPMQRLIGVNKGWWLAYIGCGWAVRAGVCGELNRCYAVGVRVVPFGSPGALGPRVAVRFGAAMGR